MKNTRWTRIGVGWFVTASLTFLMSGCGGGGGSAVLPPSSGHGVIKGRAVSTTGTPLAHATVTAVNPTTLQPVAAPVVTDQQGNFEIDNVPSGPVEVAVTGTDPNGLNEVGAANLDVQSGSTSQVQVDVQQGSQTAPDTSPKGSGLG